MNNPGAEINNNLITNELSKEIQFFFDHSAQGYLLINNDSKIVYSNTSCSNLTGYSNSELLGKPVLELIGSEYLVDFNDLLTTITLNGASYIECDIITKTINIRKVILNLTSFLEGIVISIEDISMLHNKLKHTKQQLNNFRSTLTTFTDLINKSRDILYIYDYIESKFEYLSPSASEILGYSLEELLVWGSPEFLQIIHPEYQSTYLEYWLSVKNCGDAHSYTFEYKIKPKTGISRWVNDNHKLIRDEEGNLTKVIGNIRDITEFKLVEEALDKSRDRFYKAIEATNDGLWDWDLNIPQIYFSPRFYSMAGFTPSDFSSTFNEWMSLIHPDDIPEAKKSLKLHLQGKSDQWTVEYRFRTKNGDWMWILNQGKIFEYDKFGNPQRMVGTHSDISQRRKAEEELQNRNKELLKIYEQLQFNEEKFRQLAENTLDVFWLCEKNNILYINSAFDKIWGRNHEDVYHNPHIINEWIHPDDKDIFSTWFSFEKFSKRQPLIESFRIVKSNGEIRWLWSRMFPVYNNNKELYRIAGIASDITEQKHTEEALIAAKEKALESEHLKSAFLANVSHEIRTPMNGIIGFSELLKKPNLSQENRDLFVNIISRSSDQLLHIIDDIIDISKIESNQLRLTITTFNLISLITDIHSYFETDKKNEDKGHIDIKLNIPQNISNVNITTDASRLRQILTNLISNALKFTEEGYVELGFSIQNNNIELFVKDTGIGISAEQQLQLFKHFRQLDDSMTRRFGGTGLGLAICDGLIRLLKGKIWLNSEKNQGTTFYISLPYTEASNPIISEPKDTNLCDNYNWRGKTILIVEDDEINREFLNVVLSPTNAQIITATTGESAVELSYSNPNIDLVLMDIRLPQMNGFEAFIEIRKKYPTLPIIAQTAFAMIEDALSCMELGFSDYISKPINRKKLLTIINHQFTPNCK